LGGGGGQRLAGASMGVHGRVSYVITLGILPRKVLKSKGKQRPGGFPIWEFGRHGR